MRLWVPALLLLLAGGTQVIVRTPPAPIINSLSVTSGPVGTTVVLTGVHFGATQGSGTVVFASAVTATPTTWNDISITVTVPVGAITGSVVVIQNGVTSNPVTFTVSTAGTAQTCTANTYYVRTDGNNANTGLANTPGGAWLTITKGVQTAGAGDCVRVQPGTYVEVSAPTHSGTSGNPMTVVADGAVTACGLSVSSTSYVRFVGLTWDPATTGCATTGAVVTASGTNTGLEFWNDTIGSNANGLGYNFDFNKTCPKCLWIGGSINHIAETTSSSAINLYGDDAVFAYVTIFSLCTDGAVKPGGNRLRLLNDNFSNLIECAVAGAHPDFFFPDASTSASGAWVNGLVESIWGIGTTNAADNKFAHQSNQSGVNWNSIWRLLVSYNLGSGFYSVYNNGGVGADQVRFYHNTIVNCAQATGNADCGNISLDGGGGSASIYNSIHFQAWGNSQTTNITPWIISAGTVHADYNLADPTTGTVTYGANWTVQPHALSNVNPGFTNAAAQDFTLTAGSAARGAGINETTAVSCSGTTLTVATGTGNFFVGDNSANQPAYGGKLEPGDVITIDGTTHTVASVSGDALTLDSSQVCSSGDAVYFGPSSTVDLGAYPYKATGYTVSATKSCSGPTCTITPNDATLVRFVVCYEAHVPYAVVNASPYTCNTPSGTFEARVYSKYPSATQWVVAQ